MEDKEWLNDLKVGDKVFVVTQYFNNRSKALKQVDKITPTKQIVIGNMRFKNGVLPSSDKWKTTSIYLEQATEKEIIAFRNSIFARKVLEKIKSIKEITYEQAQKIMEVMGWKEL